MKLNLAKLLFPRMPKDQRQQQLRLWLASLVVALIISGIIVCIMLLSDQMTKYWLTKL